MFNFSLFTFTRNAQVIFVENPRLKIIRFLNYKYLDQTKLLRESMKIVHCHLCMEARTRTAVVHLNFRAGSTFPVPVCTVPSSMNRISRCNKVDAVRLYASYRLNLLLLKGQICKEGLLKLRLQSLFLRIIH